MPNVGIVSLPGANVHAVSYWAKRSGATCAMVSSASGIDSFDCLILPGVGSFDVAMEYLEKQNMSKPLAAHCHAGGTVVGICLGMQILFEASEEGVLPGVGVLKGVVQRIPGGADRVPNIGWRKVDQVGENSACEYFFMHSYGVQVDSVKENPLVQNVQSVVCNTQLVASLRYKNVHGFQYHPEKSYAAGDGLLTGILHEVTGNR
jgi:imidazole glycerol-phosphate synthase subunit HisH